MSVINQMLRELENNSPAAKPLNLQAVPANPRQSWLKIIALISLIILVMVITYYATGLLSRGAPTLSEPGELSAASASSIDSAESRQSKTVTQSKNQLDLLSPEPVETALSLDQQAPSSSITIASTDTDNQPAFDQTISEIITEGELQLVSQPAPENTATTKPTAQNQQPLNQQSATLADKRSDSNSITQSIQTRLNRQLQQIQTDLKINGYQSSRSAILRLLQDKPDFHPARLYLLQIASQYRDPQLNDLYNLAVTDYPEISAYRLSAARHYFQQGDYQQTEAFLLDIQSAATHYLDLLQIRALTRQQINKHQLAIVDYSTILKQGPNRGDIYLAMGISFEALGDLVQAKRSFQNALTDQRLTTRQQAFAENKINEFQG